jgi:hypothetical protein
MVMLKTVLLKLSLFALENSRISPRPASWRMTILWTWRHHLSQTLNYKLLSLKQEAGKYGVTIKYKECLTLKLVG